MKDVVKTHRKKLQFAAPVFMVGALSFALFSFGGNSGALIQDTDPFILVAENSIHLSENTQISSGDIASNKSIQVAEDGIVNGSLFSDRLQLAGNTSINGNTTSNKLNKAETAEVFGEITNTIQKNIVELPQVPNFQTGGANYDITTDTTLDPGNYNEVTVNENATLTLTPGTYNLNKLILKDNSKLLYSDQTTVNVKSQLKIQNNILVASNSPDSNSTTDLQINYTGKPPLTIGDSSFITAKILSPTSRVHLGNKTTFRGQIFAKDVNIGEEGSLSRNLLFSKDTDPEKIIEIEGEVFPINEIIIVMSKDSTYADASNVASSVNGIIIGLIPEPKMFKIEVPSTTNEELDALIQQIESQQDPKVLFVIKNLAGGLN